MSEVRDIYVYKITGDALSSTKNRCWLHTIFRRLCFSPFAKVNHREREKYAVTERDREREREKRKMNNLKNIKSWMRFKGFRNRGMILISINVNFFP